MIGVSAQPWHVWVSTILQGDNSLKAPTIAWKHDGQFNVPRVVVSVKGLSAYKSPLKVAEISRSAFIRTFTSY
jgi:hypothetical protein